MPKKFMMNKFMVSAMTALMTFLTAAPALSSTAKKDRLVVFADKKVGDFKTDKAFRPGTSDDLEYLKLVGQDKGVHACFIGSPDNIKPIVNGMVENSNKSGNESLHLSTFETDGKRSSSIRLQISEPNKAVYLQMSIDPC